MVACRVPTAGTETELLPVVACMSADAAVSGLLAAVQRRFATAPAARGGVFTTSARLYRDCGVLLEVCSLPAATLDGAWRQLALAMATVRAAAADLAALDHPVRALVCVPSDGPFRGGDPARTQGHHVNFASAPLDDKQAAFFEACLHAARAITGPGGFVRSPAGCEFVRDPRWLHALAAANDGNRRLFRIKPGRVEVTCFGFTQNPLDVWLRLGIPWLALCAIRLRPDLVPAIACRAATPQGPVHVSWQGPSEPWPVVDLLERLLDDVLDPVLEHEEVVAAGLPDAVLWARRGIDAVRRLPATDVAVEFPSAWALKAALFARICGAAGCDLPFAPHKPARPDGNPLLAELARAGLLADCVLAPTALQRMALDLERRTWDLDILDAPVAADGRLPPPCAGATEWCWNLYGRLAAGKTKEPVAWDLP